MATKSIAYLLVVLFLLPLTLAVLNRRTDLPDLIFAGVFLTVLVVIPLVGLWSGHTWFFYYVYSVAALSLAIIFYAYRVMSLFGDQDFSVLQLALNLWPIELYFGATITVTAMLQKRRSAAESDGGSAPKG